MKKLAFLFLFCIPLLLSGADYYVATTGSDATGDGSSGNPWRTIAYALSQVTSSGNTINVADGSYSESSRWPVSVGVNVKGTSESGTIVTNTYPASGSSDASFFLYSSTLTDGNQSISHMTIRGSSLTGRRAILVMHRSNVELHHLTIEDFLATGVHFRHQIDWMTPPTTYATGNSIHDCTITNCSDRNYDSYASGNLRIDGQQDMEIYNCYFENTERPTGHNGNTFNFTNCRGIDMHDCTFKKPDSEGGEWNFFAEIFHCQGGFETYNCDFIGAANWDYSNAYNGESIKGNYDFSYSCHDNTFVTASGSQITESSVGHHTGAITLEKGDNEYAFIYNNHIKSFPYGVIISSSTNYDNTFDHVGIFNNLLENIGYSDYAYTWGIGVLLENNGGYSVTTSNMWIGNNTITGGSGYNYNAIRWVANGTGTNIGIQNNIIYGWDQGAIYIPLQSGESASFNGLDITYNCLNSNGSNTISISGSIGQTDVDISTGNITTNPTFVSSSDFHLQAGSPCISAGLSPALGTDLDGKAWYDPPSMGCYEFVETPPTTYYTYYVKNGGDDEADGKSDANAWATIAKVNASTFYPGDTILFKRGDTWREMTSLNPPSGSSEGIILFGAYGTGDKPLILSSKQEMSTGDWTVYSGSVWQNSDGYFTANVGNLIFNNEALYGEYQTSLGGVTSQGDFYFDVSANRLYLYSASNPATYYTNIECALDRPVIALHSSEDYLIFEDLDLRYSGGHGISAYSGCSYITIRDCDLSFIGGGSFESGAARYGNAIQFWGTSNQITIERNQIDQIYDAGITFQYSGTTATNITNLQVRCNLISRCEYSFEFFTHTATGSASSIYFQNNSCGNAGGGWGHNQRPDGSSGYDFLCSDISLTISNFYIRNNIFKGANQAAVRFFVSGDLADITLDYNLYNTTNIGCIGSTYYTTMTAWRTASSKDANSISGDPLWVSSSDWHLTESSPAKAAGYNVGYLTDYDLQNFEMLPSIGAYEYIGEEPPEPTEWHYGYMRRLGRYVKKQGKLARTREPIE